MKLPEFKIKVTLKQGETYAITESSDANDIFKQLFSKDTIAWTEEMVLLALNRSNHVYGWYRLSKGGLTGTVVDSRVVFSILLQAGAHSFVLAHNHPSGILKPSEPDRKVTSQLYQAGKLLDINFLDHLIVSPNGDYYSMADNGQMF
jgi:DNA repair protein RadC